MRQSPAKILVVDDDDLNLEMMEAYLQSVSYDVRTVFNGEQALALVRQAPPDVILLDVRMHGMSGYDVCRALKAGEATRHIPVLMVTGFREAEDIRQIIAAGADDLLFKPINSAIMLLRVRRMVYQKQLYDKLYG